MKSARVSLALLAALLAATAGAADAPRRRSGLWEVRTQMAGMPSQGPLLMCVDQASDNLMQERAREKVDCPVMDVSRGAGKVTIHSVCKLDGTTATTDAVITGDLDNTYRNDMQDPLQPAAARHERNEDDAGSPLARPVQAWPETRWRHGERDAAGRHRKHAGNDEGPAGPRNDETPATGAAMIRLDIESVNANS